MKHCLFIFILGTFVSCQQSKSLPLTDQMGRSIFYNEDDFAKSKKNASEVVIIDTACINEKQRALNDIKSNKLTYYYQTIAPHEREFKAELRKYRINAELGTLPSCLIVARFSQMCYQDEMMVELNRRYGNEFFDSIWNRTLEAHMKRFPNDYIEEGGKKIIWKDVYKSILK